jgi:biopolymer transport protein ExbD/biopolymer transport protein TolR
MRPVRKEAAKVNFTINVTPMVDVMLVLLIIFMVITPMLNQDRFVQMARTQHPIDMADANKADALVVALTHDGTIFVNNQLIQGAALAEKVKELLSSRVDKTVFVRADARVRYKFLVDTVDEVRAAGVDQLGLLTEQRREALDLVVN